MTTEMTRNRLPTLFEVLSRRTAPPVDLFSFYIYMRDQQRSVDYLDFWYNSLHAFLHDTVFLHVKVIPSSCNLFANHVFLYVSIQARCLSAHVSLSSLRPRTTTFCPNLHPRPRQIWQQALFTNLGLHARHASQRQSQRQPIRREK